MTDRQHIVRRTDPGGSHEAAEVVSLDPRVRMRDAVEDWLDNITTYRAPGRGTYLMLATYLADQGFCAEKEDPIEGCRRELRNMVDAKWLVASNDKLLKLRNERSKVLCQVLMLPPTSATVLSFPNRKPFGRGRLIKVRST